MLRNDQPGPIPDSERSTILPSELPTTPEIVQEGLVHFRSVAHALPEGRGRNLFLSHKGIRTAFVGISPQIVTQAVRSSEMEVLKQTVDETTQGFITVQFSPDRHGLREYVTFLNLKAAERIVEVNLTAFPDALENPHQWLQTHTEDYLRDDTMMGLLSGYPRWDIHPFGVFIDVMKRTDRMWGLPPEDHEFYGQFTSGEIDRTPENIAKMTKIFRDFVVDATDEEIRVLVHAQDYSIEDNHPFLGFDKKRDEVYIAEVSKIYKESGIDGIAKELRDAIQK